MTGDGLLIDRDYQGNPSFQVEAELLRVETDSRMIDATAFRSQAKTTVRTFEHALVSGSAARADGRVLIQGLDSVVVPEWQGALCGRAESAPTESYVYRTQLEARPALRIPLDDAVVWNSCGAPTLTVHGNFTIVLWNWDAEVAAPSGRDSLPSGPGNLQDGTLESKEQFLFARNATIRLPASQQAIHVRGLQVDAPQASLAEIEGTLEGQPISGQLELLGKLHMQIQGQGADAPMLVSALGVESARLDGQAITLHSPESNAPWWPWLMSLTLVFGGFVYARPHFHYWHHERTGKELGSLVPKTLGQRRAVGIWIMARAAQRRGWYRLSLWRASRASDLFRPLPEAQFTRAVAAGELGRHADAMTDFLDLYNRHDEPAGRAAAACGIAQECCRMKRWENGKEWLLLATSESFEYTHIASLESDYNHFIGEPWFDALRRGRAVPGSLAGPGQDPSIQ